MSFRLLKYCFIPITFFIQACRSELKPDTIALHIVFPKSKIQSLLGKYVFLMDEGKTVIDSVLFERINIGLNKKWILLLLLLWNQQLP